jgi:Cephalosporin hydroxylase
MVTNPTRVQGSFRGLDKLTDATQRFGPFSRQILHFKTTSRGWDFLGTRLVMARRRRVEASVFSTPLAYQFEGTVLGSDTTYPTVHSAIEAGTADGGSAYYFANLFDLMGRGRVITIDIGDSPERPKHNRITYLLGSSTAPAIVDKVKSLIAPGERVMVSLDSDHRKPHVAQDVRRQLFLWVDDNYFSRSTTTTL